MFTFIPSSFDTCDAVFPSSVTLFTACILYSIKKSRHRNYLLRNFNDGKCPECGGEYEQIECEREYGLYKCSRCGKIIKVDDGDVDFAWNLRHYIL